MAHVVKSKVLRMADTTLFCVHHPVHAHNACVIEASFAAVERSIVGTTNSASPFSLHKIDTV